MSLGVSIVLLLLYGGEPVLHTGHPPGRVRRDERDEPRDALRRCSALAVLVARHRAGRLEAELVSGALRGGRRARHFSPLFLGVVVLALVGTGGDLFAAVVFARQDKMGLVLSIAIGSAIQIALVVAPLLVLISWLIGHPMTLVFRNPLQLFAIAGTAIIVSAIARDGEATWFEGCCWSASIGLLALGILLRRLAAGLRRSARVQHLLSTAGRAGANVVIACCVRRSGRAAVPSGKTGRRPRRRIDFVVTIAIGSMLAMVLLDRGVPLLMASSAGVSCCVRVRRHRTCASAGCAIPSPAGLSLLLMRGESCRR